MLKGALQVFFEIEQCAHTVVEPYRSLAAFLLHILPVRPVAEAAVLNF